MKLNNLLSMASRIAADKALPREVQEFINAAMTSAAQAWPEDEDEDKEGRQAFFKKLLYIEHTPEGIQISDNFERFFDIIFLYTNDGEWMTRRFREPKFSPYDSAKALQDASMLYGG